MAKYLTDTIDTCQLCAKLLYDMMTMTIVQYYIVYHKLIKRTTQFAIAANQRLSE